MGGFRRGFSRSTWHQRAAVNVDINTGQGWTNKHCFYNWKHGTNSYAWNGKLLNLLALIFSTYPCITKVLYDAESSWFAFPAGGKWEICIRLRFKKGIRKRKPPMKFDNTMTLPNAIPIGTYCVSALFALWCLEGILSQSQGNSASRLKYHIIIKTLISKLRMNPRDKSKKKVNAPVACLFYSLLSSP